MVGKLSLRKIRNLVLSQGIVLGRAVSDGEVRQFLGSLHPVKTDIPLIRLGGEADGGYLVPDDLEGIAACFSPGVDVLADFETAMVQRGIPCFLADASVEKAPIEHPLIHFQRKYLGFKDGEMSLDAWVADLAPPQGDLLLQIDIEGAEWPVLLNSSDETLGRFRIIVAEFHDLENVFNRSDLRIFEAVFQRLLRQFHLVHIHPNNVYEPIIKGDIVIPSIVEMTFLRKDRVEAKGFATQFPHSLDRPNVPGRTDIVLPRAWYHAS